MDTPTPFNPQEAINVMPEPPSDERNRMSQGGRVPPEDRYSYSTPNLSKDTTPTPNPPSTTNYGIKAPHPGGAA